jgi:sRNA-binding protein
MSDTEQKAIDLLASVATFLENVAKSKVPSIKGQNHEAATHRHLRAMKLSAANIRDEINVFLGDDAALTRVLEKMQTDGKIIIDGDMVYLAAAQEDL